MEKIKKCNCCGVEKHISNYCKHSSTADKRSNICKTCKNDKQRERRGDVYGNVYTLRYEKTKSGFLVRTYRNMLSRVNGIQKLKVHLYGGKSILDKADFYDWSKNDNDFNRLFEAWKNSGYERRLTPSIDRRDSSLGYDFGNIRWITFSENSALGLIARWKNRKIEVTQTND